MDKISLSRIYLNLIWSIFENNNLSINTVPLSSIKGTFLKGFKFLISSARWCPIKKRKVSFTFILAVKSNIIFSFIYLVLNLMVLVQMGFRFSS